ncbi:MAG: hypothetical protein ACTSP4_02650 [Candidatus Hodarchaeales archaeon]
MQDNTVNVLINQLQEKNVSMTSATSFTKQYNAHWRWALLLHLISLLRDFQNVEFNLSEHNIHIKLTEDDMIITEDLMMKKLTMIQDYLSKLCSEEIQLDYLSR